MLGQTETHVALYGRLQNTEDSGSDFHDLPEPELPKVSTATQIGA